MTIVFLKTLDDFLGEIGPFHMITVNVKDENVFRADFDKNIVLTTIIGELYSFHPLTLDELLSSGGYQLCEMGINVAMYGEPGSTNINVYAGDKGIVYLLHSKGKGFNVNQTYSVFANNGKYYEHKGSGFKSFSKPHVSVAYYDNGCTGIIKSLYH